MSYMARVSRLSRFRDVGEDRTVSGRHDWAPSFGTRTDAGRPAEFHFTVGQALSGLSRLTQRTGTTVPIVGGGLEELLAVWRWRLVAVRTYGPPHLAHQRCVRLIDVRPLLRRQPLLGLIQSVPVLTDQRSRCFRNRVDSSCVAPLSVRYR